MPEFKRPASAAGAAGRGEELAVIAPDLKRYRAASSSALVPKVTQASIRRLARRAGVKRISGDFYADAERGLREVLSHWIRDIAVITEYSRRRTTTLSDVLLVLKKHGRPLYGFEERQRRRRLTAPLPQESLNASFQRVVARRRAGGKGLAPRAEASIGDRVRREAVVGRGAAKEGTQSAELEGTQSSSRAISEQAQSSSFASAVSEVSAASEEEVEIGANAAAVAAAFVARGEKEGTNEAGAGAAPAALADACGKPLSTPPRALPATPSASVASSARLVPPTPGGTPASAARPRGQRTLDALFRTPAKKAAEATSSAAPEKAGKAPQEAESTPCIPAGKAPQEGASTPRGEAASTPFASEPAPRAPLSPASSSCGPAAPLTPERAERIQAALASFREAASARGDGGGVSTPALHRWVLAELAAGGEGPCTMGDLEVVLDALDARAAVVLANDPDTDIPTVYFC